MTDTYTYMADGVKELEYPVPNPEPIAQLLHGLREDERLNVLHTDNGNPSIIAENLEESEAITKTLVDTFPMVQFFPLDSNPQTRVYTKPIGSIATLDS